MTGMQRHLVAFWRQASIGLPESLDPCIGRLFSTFFYYLERVPLKTHSARTHPTQNNITRHSYPPAHPPTKYLCFGLGPQNPRLSYRTLLLFARLLSFSLSNQRDGRPKLQFSFLLRVLVFLLLISLKRRRGKEGLQIKSLPRTPPIFSWFGMKEKRWAEEKNGLWVLLVSGYVSGTSFKIEEQFFFFGFRLPFVNGPLSNKHNNINNGSWIGVQAHIHTHPNLFVIVYLVTPSPHSLVLTSNLITIPLLYPLATYSPFSILHSPLSILVFSNSKPPPHATKRKRKAKENNNNNTQACLSFHPYRTTTTTTTITIVNNNNKQTPNSYPHSNVHIFHACHIHAAVFVWLLFIVCVCTMAKSMCGQWCY